MIYLLALQAVFLFLKTTQFGHFSFTRCQHFLLLLTQFSDFFLVNDFSQSLLERASDQRLQNRLDFRIKVKQFAFVYLS